MQIPYIEPVFRPPSEARSLILQVTNGCSWNKCTFCEMYTLPQKKFSLKPLDEIEAEVVQLVRDTTGAVACLRQALVVKRLPKTRSGKILRGTMVSIADGKDWKMPATIDDPVILDEITEALQALGYAK